LPEKSLHEKIVELENENENLRRENWAKKIKIARENPENENLKNEIFDEISQFFENNFIEKGAEKIKMEIEKMTKIGIFQKNTDLMGENFHLNFTEFLKISFSFNENSFFIYNKNGEVAAYFWENEKGEIIKQEIKKLEKFGDEIHSTFVFKNGQKKLIEKLILTEKGNGNSENIFYPDFKYEKKYFYFWDGENFLKIEISDEARAKIEAGDETIELNDSYFLQKILDKKYQICEKFESARRVF